MSEIKTLAFALTGGILPALLWLWFWLKEDAAHPEPRARISLAFLGGMAAVMLALVLEHSACSFLGYESCMGFGENETLAVLLALIEEGVKFLIVFLIAFHSRYFDEPVDAIVYLITVALGFAAMENTMYLFDTATNQGLTMGVINGNLRFIGATVLHVASSAILGITVAFPFYRHTAERVLWALVGIIIATLLHTLFNLSIIKAETIGESLRVFSYIWVAIIIIMLTFEKVKHVHPEKEYIR